MRKNVIASTSGGIASAEERFPTFAEVLGAPVIRLTEIIKGAGAALDLKIVAASLQRMAKGKV